MCTHNLSFEQKKTTKNKNNKYPKFSIENFQFLQLKKSLHIAWTYFRNYLLLHDVIHWKRATSCDKKNIYIKIVFSEENNVPPTV